MNEIFRFMALRPPDTSNLAPTIDITNPKSALQGTLSSARNRSIGQPNLQGESSPSNPTVQGVPLRALRNVSLAAGAIQNPVPAKTAKPARSPKIRKVRE
jgi:hypothetical protein